jgi:hypothetical protein
MEIPTKLNHLDQGYLFHQIQGGQQMEISFSSKQINLLASLNLLEKPHQQRGCIIPLE